MAQVIGLIVMFCGGIGLAMLLKEFPWKYTKHYDWFEAGAFTVGIVIALGAIFGGTSLMAGQLLWGGS